MTPRQIVEDFYDRIWNRLDKAAIPELIHPDFTFRGSLGPTMRDHAAFSAYVDGVTDALADYRCTILDLVTEANGYLPACALRAFTGPRSWALPRPDGGSTGPEPPSSP